MELTIKTVRTTEIEILKRRKGLRDRTQVKLQNPLLSTDIVLTGNEVLCDENAMTTVNIKFLEKVS